MVSMQKTHGKSKRFILFGLLITLGVYTAAILLSGRIVGGDIFTFFNTGPQILLFPVLLGAACVASALLSAKYNAPELFHTVLIALCVPVAALLTEMGVFAFLPDTVFLVLFMPLMYLCMPASSVYQAVSDLSDSMTYAWPIFTLTAVAGVAASIVIYRRKNHTKEKR